MFISCLIKNLLTSLRRQAFNIVSGYFVGVGHLLSAGRGDSRVYRDEGMVFRILLRRLAAVDSSCLSTSSFLVRLGLDGGAVLYMPSSGGLCSLSAFLSPGPYFLPHLLTSSCFDGS